MWRAKIITPWTGTGATQQDAYRPLLPEVYGASKFEDTTGQPSANLQPDPNIYAVYIECDPAVLDVIAADGDYLILWSEEIPVDGP